MVARSSRLMLLGTGTFVVGAALVALTLQAGSDSAPAAEAAQTPPASAQADPDPPAQVRLPPAVTAPDGREVVAVQLPFAAGVAGLPAAGDRVNVYGVVTRAGADADAAAAAGVPYVRLVLANVEVLGVSGPSVEANGGTPTFLLSVTPSEAEQVIFLASVEKAWLTLVAPDASAPLTTGRNHGNLQ